MELMGFVLIAVFFYFAYAIYQGYQSEDTRAKYRASLEKLKHDPNNPNLRQATLALGRIYSEAMRDSKGRTIFDEIALKNDIDAACAGATTGRGGVFKVEVTNTNQLFGESVAQEIERLGQLFLRGVITADEFERGKTMFLGTPPNKAAAAVELLSNLQKLKEQGVLSESEFNSKKWEILSERLLPRMP